VLHTLAHNKLKEFKDILLKIDPQLGKWQDSLLATCRYFMARKEGVLLLEFQVLMRDFVRAGLTCIKLFERTEDVPVKISYLNLAKQYLQQGLEEYQSEVKQQGGTVSINSNILGTKSISDIHRYIKTINLQLEVAKFMQSLLAKNKSSAKKEANNSNTNQPESEPNEGEDETADARKKKKQKNSLFGTPQAKSSMCSLIHYCVARTNAVQSLPSACWWSTTSTSASKSCKSSTCPWRASTTMLC
jgi:hypothetical protein